MESMTTANLAGQMHSASNNAPLVASRRLRVLFTMVELGPGGVETNILNLLKQLDEDHFDTSLFLHHQPGTKGRSREVPAHVDVSWAVRGRYSRLQLPFMLRRLVHAARGCDVIVAAQEGRSTLLAWMAATLLRKPLVGCIQFDWGAFQQHTKRRQRWGLKWLCPRMQRVVACGHDAAKSLQKIVRIDPAKIQVVPNFVCAADIRRQADAPMPVAYEHVFAKPTILGMGRLNHQKGFETLIHAHANLRKSGLDHHLMIIGEGELRNKFESLIEQLNVANSVFLPGFCQNPFPMVRRAAAFALPSRFEGLPFALIEAMTLGIPVVASDCPSGPREVLADGHYGSLTPVGDIDQLADALARLLTDSEHHRVMSQRSRERASDYADTTVLQAWQDLLMKSIDPLQ